eukprot:7074795-Karenia_brevis.AAC.1
MPPAFMKCQEWPEPDNNPTLGVTLEYQTQPHRDSTTADKVWNGSNVITALPLTPPPAWHADPQRVSLTTITIHEMMQIA